MFKKFIASLATVLLTVGVSVIAVTMPAGATSGYPTGSDANQPGNWQLLDGESCIKIEPVNVVPYVLPAPPAGRTYSKIVVKAGSEQSVNEPNAVFLNPTPGQGYMHPEKDSISHIILCTVPVPFDWNWQYAAPTCDALTVTYPANIPAGQANDVNVRIKYGSGFTSEITLNFHNNSGTWSGTQGFTYSTHPNWPANIGPYKVVWTQVGGTNYHWEGEVSCGTPQDSAAAISTTPATCSAAEQLVLGAVTNATWGAVTGAYSVTATATAGHLFPGGSTTKTFTGSLAPALSSTDPACAPPPVCIPKSAVSYTYNPATNSGVITVANVPNSTGQLCQGFWVTATSWKYTTGSVWPQIRDVVQKLPKITTPGTYPYEAAVTCGQGDIYASFTAQPDPTYNLYGPNNPFNETFLHGMGFTGPSPTYVQQFPGCNNAEVTVPTANAITECGTYGSVNVPADTAMIDYTLTGNGQTGINTVTAVAKVPYVLKNYPAGGWTFDLKSYTDCTVLMNLTYIQECTPDEDNTWRVYNPTSETIVVSYAAYGGGPSGTHSATPGYSYFTTPRASETMIITWGAAGSGIAVGSKTKAAGTDLPATDPACIKLAEPVEPDLVLVDKCGMYGSVTPVETKGVDYLVEFDQVTGEYTVTATPQSGYYFADNKTEVVYSDSVGAYEECVVEPKVSHELGVCYPNGTEPDRFSSKNVYIKLDNSISDVPVTFHVVGAADVTGPNPSADIVRTLAPGEKVTVETTPIWDQGGGYTVEFTSAGYTIPNGEIVIPPFVGCLDGNPGDPTHTNSQCVSGELIGGSITVELIEGFTYTITGPNGFEWISADVDTVTGLVPGLYVASIEAAEGYILTGDTEWPYEVEIEGPVNCITNDAAAAIDTAPATCLANGKVDPTKTSLTHASWNTAFPTAPGNHTMVATADSGHAFAGGLTTKSFPIVIEAMIPSTDPSCQLPDLALVTPTVSQTQPTCTAPGSYTLGELDPGTITWTVDGAPKALGTYAIASGQITLVAAPTKPLDGLANWTNPKVLTFTPPSKEACDLQLTTLALTGLGASLGIPLAGGLIFLGIGGLLIFARKRREV